MDIKTRLMNAVELRKVDSESRVVEFVASDNSVDSYGTVVPVEGWDLTRFNANGIIGYQHEVYGGDVFKSSDPDDVIGKGEARIEDGQLLVRIEFEPAELNEKADKIFRKIQFGSLRGVSVGFMPTAEGHWGDEERGEDKEVYYYAGQELLEVSVVNIPSNANALRRSIDAELDELKALRKQEEPEAPVQIENEPEVKAEDSTINIRITTARAKALLAQNHHTK